ncbi:MAG: ABC transporter ATP-binding protein [Ilumatobacteraceae bacterium]
MTLLVDAGVQLGPLPLAVEVEIRPGEVLAVLGPNGAGKSSLLRVVAGLVALERGTVAVDGTVLDDPSAGVFVPPERRPVGMVFQDYLLFANLSALDNVAFGPRARGVPKATARRRAAELLERMDLTSHAGARPSGLSGGQAQRVALARALATEPRVLLLDEPLSALDATTRTGVRRDLRHHLDEFAGMTVVVTHDPVDAYALADRVAIVDHGRVVQEGTIADVTAHPRSRYVADLVGTNLVSGDVAGGVLRTASGAEVVVAGADAGPSFAVIRPQSVVLQRRAAEDSSVRNAWPGTVATVDLLGDRARIGIDGALPLTAEITTAALAALNLLPGSAIVATVKATDITAYPA